MSVLCVCVFMRQASFIQLASFIERTISSIPRLKSCTGNQSTCFTLGQVREKDVDLGFDDVRGDTCMNLDALLLRVSLWNWIEFDDKPGLWVDDRAAFWQEKRRKREKERKRGFNNSKTSEFFIWVGLCEMLEWERERDTKGINRSSDSTLLDQVAFTQKESERASPGPKNGSLDCLGDKLLTPSKEHWIPFPSFPVASDFNGIEPKTFFASVCVACSTNTALEPSPREASQINWNQLELNEISSHYHHPQREGLNII